MALISVGRDMYKYIDQEHVYTMYTYACTILIHHYRSVSANNTLIAA